MYSQETLEYYKRMTNAERAKVTFQMMREAWPFLLSGSPEVVARKLELLERENNVRNESMLEGISLTKESP